MTDIVKMTTVIKHLFCEGAETSVTKQITPVSALEGVCALRKEGGEPVPPNATSEPCVIQTRRAIALQEATVTRVQTGRKHKRKRGN